MSTISTKNSFSMSLMQISEILSASFTGEDIIVNGISTDTRTIQGGELFIALKGPNFDGHKFIELAFEKGAAACLIQEDILDNSDRLVNTNDTHKALGLLAKAWREEFNIPVFAITGSNGKTTVKEMISSIISQNQDVMATHGNFNNDIGVPLTLFRLNKNNEAAVIEMGANHVSEISYLTQLTLPTVAIITNIGSAHLDGFGSLDNTAKAKSEIFLGLAENGTAIINADDDFYNTLKANAANYNILTFGVNNKADITATARTNHDGCLLNVSTPKGQCEVKLQLLGNHNVMNALAAIAATTAAGYPLSQIVKGLENLKPVAGRLQVKQGVNESCVIDDTYNANPTSLYAAINVMQNFSGKRYLALGDMGELGANEEQIHSEAGTYAKTHGVDALYSYGHLANNAAKTFGSPSYSYNKQEDMIDALKKDLAKDVTLLVKGSRSMHMENVVNELTESRMGQG
ncbi:MAG: UDP-N-acetylmuramoyl-tripeptide--D-alanyl-D-alanine ligase [Woeseiaceae bacterium]